jgi:fermentation-respiration switch protein FrsA (DUF1100 family)
VLLVYGDDDEYTPPHYGERLMRAFGEAAKTELRVIKGVGHTFAYCDAADAYTKRAIHFLAKTLRSEMVA